MSANENQIVVYQPDETVRLDVRLENETVWLTQLDSLSLRIAFTAGSAMRRLKDVELSEREAA